MTINSIRYCVQCTDKDSGKVGDFIVNEIAYSQGKGFYAISPIFTNLVELFQYAKQLGYTEHSFAAPFTISRK